MASKSFDPGIFRPWVRFSFVFFLVSAGVKGFLRHQAHEDDRYAPVRVDAPAPSSGMPFTLRAPDRQAMTLLLPYEFDVDFSTPGQYRVVYETPADTYYQELTLTGSYGRGILECDLYAGIDRPLEQGARIHVERYQFFQGEGTRVSNIVVLPRSPHASPVARRSPSLPDPQVPTVTSYSHTFVPQNDASAATNTDTSFGGGDSWSSSVDPEPWEEETESWGVDDPTADDFFTANSEAMEEFLFKRTIIGEDRRRRVIVTRLARADKEACTDKATRKKIALQFRDLLTGAQSSPFPDELYPIYLEGLLNWGGSYAAPILIDALEISSEHTHPTRRWLNDIVRTLGQTHNPVAVEAVARVIAAKQQVGAFVTDEHLEVAGDALIALGAESEEAAARLVPLNDPDICYTAIRVLAEVGGKKSLTVLRRAAKSRNAEISAAAVEAIKTIRART
ncbi:MAG: HEAT repeat domain-containing protein [Planctomycetota bacterium]